MIIFLVNTLNDDILQNQYTKNNIMNINVYNDVLST